MLAEALWLYPAPTQENEKEAVSVTFSFPIDFLVIYYCMDRLRRLWLS